MGLPSAFFSDILSDVFGTPSLQEQLIRTVCSRAVTNTIGEVKVTDPLLLDPANQRFLVSPKVAVRLQYESCLFLEQVLDMVRYIKPEHLDELSALLGLEIVPDGMVCVRLVTRTTPYPTVETALSPRLEYLRDNPNWNRHLTEKGVTLAGLRILKHAIDFRIQNKNSGPYVRSGNVIDRLVLPQATSIVSCGVTWQNVRRDMGLSSAVGLHIPYTVLAFDIPMDVWSSEVDTEGSTTLAPITAYIHKVVSALLPTLEKMTDQTEEVAGLCDLNVYIGGNLVAPDPAAELTYEEALVRLVNQHRPVI